MRVPNGDPLNRLTTPVLFALVISTMAACVASGPDVSGSDPGLRGGGRDRDPEPGVDPALDVDGDSIADHRDACLETPPGARALASGCSTIDLVRSADLAVAHALELAEDARVASRAEPALADLAPAVE